MYNNYACFEVLYKQKNMDNKILRKSMQVKERGGGENHKNHESL